MDRFKTGIAGLDRQIGGIPSGRTMLITGEAGSGKTIFALQFARSCCESGLKTIYISSEEEAGDLRLQAASFGWQLDKYEKAGHLTFVELVGRRATETEAVMGIGLQARKGNFGELLKHIPKDTNAFIIDSLGSQTANLTSDEFRDRFDLMIHILKKRGITSIVVLDSATSRDLNDIAMFSVYGAIRLLKRENPYTGRRERVLDVVKMRSTMTPIQLLSYDIGPQGLEILSAPEAPEKK
jgi:KaiC/GvpD/RAD55 family RecA-like ATPase